MPSKLPDVSGYHSKNVLNDIFNSHLENVNQYQKYICSLYLILMSVKNKRSYSLQEKHPKPSR